MDATGVLQQLWNDHRVSAHLLGIAERCLPAGLDGDTESLEVVRDIVARECEYGDLVHHAREELLFTRLASRSSAGRDAVKGLTHDHNELGRMGTTLLESLEARLAGRPEDPELLQRRGTDYADAVRNHMRKEERRVFELAPTILMAEDWHQVAGAFADSKDPLAPPVAVRWQDLDAWLARHGEVLFESSGLGR